MSNATPSRLGQIQGAGAVDALFLMKYAGEVLTAYEQAKKLKPTVRVRTVSGQKSAQFPAVFTTEAEYHVPGAEIVGAPIQHNEIIVTIDDLLIAHTFVAMIDELKNHYDVRSPYSTEQGRALALLEDRTIAQNIILAARGGELFTGDGGGSSVVQADVGGTADFDASGSDLLDAVNLGKQALDEKDVPVDVMPVYAAFKPAQWYLMARSDKNLNRDFGGQSTVGNQVLRTVSDVQIFKSNALMFGKDVTPFNAGTNADGVVGAVGSKIPAAFPAKYHADLTNTRGAVWVEPAVAYLQLLGLTTEAPWDARRQGTLLLAKMAIGMGKLRSKCAVEIKTA